jgi:hypothetical protein|tara:strand:+ start:1192 stop:1368 length:177 start_codon:yes stop_codon:yes gene_type:complete
MEKSGEPIIGCIDEYCINESYFFNKVINKDEEIYVMDDKDIAKIEARNYLQLAKEYFE